MNNVMVQVGSDDLLEAEAKYHAITRQFSMADRMLAPSFESYLHPKEYSLYEYYDPEKQSFWVHQDAYRRLQILQSPHAPALVKAILIKYHTVDKL